jgi:hypothetical protein
MYIVSCILFRYYVFSCTWRRPGLTWERPEPPGSQGTQTEKRHTMVRPATPATTDFVQPPDYDQTAKWSDMVGKYGVLEPFDFIPNAQTRYGPRDAWDCTFW